MDGTQTPASPARRWGGGLVGASRIAALAVAAMGGMVLAGWLLDLAALVRLRDGLPGMNPVTAGVLVIAGLATWLLADGDQARHARHGRVLAVAVAVVGALRLAGPGWLADPFAGFLAPAWRERPGWVPMAPATATALMLLGVGLAIADAQRLGARRWSQSLLLAALAPALLSVALYAYGAPFEPVLTFFAPMAVHTAIAIVVLVCAGLLVRPRGGVMAVVTGESAGSAVFRFMLPVVVVVPLALGGLSLLGRAHRPYDPAQGAALVATVTAMLLVTGLWYVARRLAKTEAARQRAELALAESRLRLDLVLRSVGVGVWDWDVSRDAVSFDDTVAELWRVPPGRSLAMQQVLERLHPDDRAAAMAQVRAALAETSEYASSCRVVRPDGTVRVVAMRGFVTRDRRGRAVRLAGILWDTTPQHEAEVAREQLQHEQLELKDQFLSHVSHELRSPLTVIFSFVEILLDGLAGELNEQQREFLAITHRNAAQLRQMIDDLLEVTRAQTGKLVVNARRLDLAPDLEATIGGLRPQAEERRIRISSEIPAGLPAVLADPYRVRQVLVNLLENALKFTPEGGAIRVSVGASPAPDEAVAVSVTDSGPGIPAAERDSIFRQLYQLDCAAPVARKGLGLGLFICRQLVTRMGGRIWVDGAPAGGSVFTFTLPRFSPASAIEPLLTPENVARGEFRLVIVTFRPLSARTWSERDDAAVGAATEVLQHCALPDRDLVLPRLGAEANEESIGVLACAGSVDAGVLVRRVEGQLPRSEMLRAARLAWSVHVVALDAAAVPGQTAQGLAAELSSRIDDALASSDDRRSAA